MAVRAEARCAGAELRPETAMKITCAQCHARYSVADERVVNRRVKIRCRRCDASISVDGQSAPLELHVLVAGEQRGPLELEAVRALLGRSEIDGTTLGWHPGLEDWSALARIEALRGLALTSEPESPFDVPLTSPFEAAPSAPISPALTAATGARSESSVLFSFENLSGLARAAPARTAAPVSGDGSGLIDIRALAAATAPSAPRSSAAGIEPLVLPTLDVPLLGPLTPPVVLSRSEGPRSSRLVPVVAGLAAALALTLGGLAFALSSSARTPVEVAAPAPIAPGPAPAPIVEDGPVPVIVPTIAAVEPSPEVVETPSVPAVATVRDRPRVREHDRDVATTPPIAPARAAHGEPTIEERLERAVSHEATTPADEVAPRAVLASSPSREAVRTAMTALEPAIRECAGGRHGRALVSVVVGGDTGHGRSATVGGDFAGTPEGSCIARVARGVSVDPFERATFTIAFPYSL